MKERPILFSGPMVRALLSGAKTQTRRAVKLKVPADADEVFYWTGDDLRSDGCSNVAETGLWARRHGRDGYLHFLGRCPYGDAGDRLWVKETHVIYDTHGQHRSDGLRWGPWGHLPTTLNPERTKIAYFREGFDRCDPGRWRPSIHMPRWASRLTLEVAEIRVQRLHDTTEADAEVEGVREPSIGPIHMVSPERCGEIDRAKAPALFLWEMLWTSINGADSWPANPWVWVVIFRQVEDRV